MCYTLNKETSVQDKGDYVRDCWLGTEIKKQVDVKRCLAQSA